MDRTRFEVRFAENLPEDGVDRARHRPGGVLRVAQSRRGAPPARTNRLWRGALADHARAEDADGDDTARVQRRRSSRPSAATPGLIFDEVDAGIGGRVADVVGRKLRVLGSAFQVLCITHLPQIAAYADTHFLIQKAHREGADADDGRQADREHARRGDQPYAGRRGGHRRDSRVGPRNAGRAQGLAKAKGEMKPKGESESRARRAPR